MTYQLNVSFSGLGTSQGKNWFRKQINFKSIPSCSLIFLQKNICMGVIPHEKSEKNTGELFFWLFTLKSQKYLTTPFCKTFCMPFRVLKRVGIWNCFLIFLCKNSNLFSSPHYFFFPRWHHQSGAEPDILYLLLQISDYSISKIFWEIGAARASDIWFERPPRAD